LPKAHCVKKKHLLFSVVYQDVAQSEKGIGRCSLVQNRMLRCKNFALRTSDGRRAWMPQPAKKPDANAPGSNHLDTEIGAQ
jgi:hypothetical protein